MEKESGLICKQLEEGKLLCPAPAETGVPGPVCLDQGCPFISERHRSAFGTEQEYA